MASYRRPLSAKNQPVTSGSQKPKKSRIKNYDKAQLLSDYKGVTTLTTSSSISMCENDLTNPVPERTQQFYLTILNYVMPEFTVDAFKQAAFVSESFEHPELLDDITYRIQFVRVMKKVMHSCNVHDFGTNDLVNPESKRTCRNLGALFNYLRYECSVYNGQDTIIAIKDETEKIKEEWTTRQMENRASKHQIRALKEQKNEEKELDIELRHAAMAQQQETYTLQVHHQAARKKHEEILEVCTKQEQKLELLTEELKKWTQRDEDLRNQIVTSPDKLKATLAHLENQVLDSRKVKEETKNLLTMWESLISSAHQTPSVVTGLNEDLSLLSAKVDKKSQLQSSLVSIQEQIGRQKQELREATAKHQNLLRHVKLIEDESNHTQYDGQYMPHFHASESLQRDVSLLQQELKDKERGDVEIEKETLKLRAKITVVHERFQKSCDELTQMADRMQDAVHAQMAKYFELSKPITG